MKPRTQAEIDALYLQYPGLKDSLDAAAYADYHNTSAAWERDQQGTYDSYTHNDTKHEQTFPRVGRTIWRTKA